MPADGRNGPSSVAADTLGVPENEARRRERLRARLEESLELPCYGVSSLKEDDGPITVRDTAHTVGRVNYHVRPISDVHNCIVSSRERRVDVINDWTVYWLVSV